MLSALRTLGRKVFSRTGPRGSLLRRCDWRFLLPMAPGGSFEHVVLLGAPEGLAELIVSAGIARRVSERIPADRCVDALVIMDRSDASPKSAEGCLLHECVVYWEIDRRRQARSSVTQAYRALRSGGLSPTAAYWVRPRACVNLAS